MNRNRLKNIQYFLSDFLGSYLVWLVFVLIRRTKFENNPHLDEFHFIAAAIIALGWCLMYATAGLYNRPYRRAPPPGTV